ncbi:MAG TPA: YaeQ family protein [Nitrospiria bacterium]|jgi:uncharacterized protein YaeQ
MAFNATIYKAVLQIANLDRNYYQERALTLARHPSETDERLMVRVLAFALHASEGLSFAHGRIGAGLIKAGEEPDLWKKNLTGEVELWIEVGLPDERAIRKACNRAQQVVVYAYGGHKADRWWEQNRGVLGQANNLTIVNLSNETTRAIAAMAQRDLKLNCTIQDGHIWFGEGEETVEVELTVMLKCKT